MNSTTINKGCKKNAYIIIYYLFLLGIFFTWHDFQNNPGIAPRLAYFSLVAGPLFFINKDWAVPIVTLFFILAKDNYTSSYLPTELYTYILLLLAIAIVRGRRNMLTETPLVVFLLFAITLICNLFFGTFENVTGMLLLLILALQSGGAKDAMTTKYLSYSFVVAGVVISVYQIQYGEMMAVESWMGTEQIERQGFKDINYTACVISLGVCAAMINIFVEKTLNNIWKLILVSSILLMVYSLFVNASRGSILAVAFPALVLLICSKTKLWLKIFSIVFVLLALYVAYVNGVMDYLLFRIENDSTGTGRTEIWSGALNQYNMSQNALNMLLGYGYEGGRNLVHRALHNDFIAFLVEYGFIGFCCFIVFFFRPLFKMSKGNRAITLAAVSALFAVSMTLEPFAAGRWPFYAFWLYALSLGKYGYNSKRQ